MTARLYDPSDLPGMIGMLLYALEILGSLLQD